MFWYNIEKVETIKFSELLQVIQICSADNHILPISKCEDHCKYFKT